MADETRAALGSVYRLTVDFLARRGLLDEVKRQASPATLKLLEKPPPAFAWQGYEVLEDIERILFAMPNGRDLCADLGHAAASQLSGGVVEPIFRMAVSLFGKTPASLLAHLDRFFSMVVRGFSFNYEPRSEKDGLLTAQISGGAVHESLFQQLRGNLRVIFDLCGAEGTVDTPEIVRHDSQGALVRFAVRWE